MKIKKDHISFIAIVLLLGCLGVAAFFQPKLKPAGPGATLGALFPLSGKFANFGEDSKNGAELAAAQVKAHGFNLRVIYEDSAAEPKTALAAADKLINADKVGIILGSAGSSANLAVAPLMGQSRTLFVAVSANPKLKDSGDFVFKLHPDVDGEVGQMTQLMVGKGFKKVAVIYDSSSDTNSVAKDVFLKVFQESGGSASAEGFDSKTTNDFRSILAKLQSARPEALYILTIDQSAAQILQQVKELGLKIPVFGWSGSVSPQLLKVAGQAAEGYTFTDYAFSCDGSQTMEDYCASYQDKFPNTLPTEYGAHIYDAVNILAEIIKKFGSDPNIIRQHLLQVENYPGVSGNITFGGKRYVEGRDFVFRQVKDGKFVEINK